MLKNHLSGFGELKSREKGCQGFNLKQTELCEEEDCWVVVRFSRPHQRVCSPNRLDERRVCLKSRGFPRVSSVRSAEKAGQLGRAVRRPDQAQTWSAASSLSCFSAAHAFEVFNVLHPGPKPMTLFFLQLSSYARRCSWGSRAEDDSRVWGVGGCSVRRSVV